MHLTRSIADYIRAKILKMGIYKSLGVFAAIILLASCNPGQAWKKRTIDNKEKSIMEAAKKGKIDTAGVNDLLAAYDAYVSA